MNNIRKINYFTKILMYLIIKIISILYKKIFLDNQEIWIISERGNEAKDNAYFFYNYLKKQNTKEKIFYIIDKNSPDIEKLIDSNSTIDYRSFKHWLYFCMADIKISTHIMGCAPDIRLFQFLKNLKLVNGKEVFLQHGIIYNDFESLHYKNVKLDLFVTSVDDEYEHVTKKFGHPKNVVKKIGLCRYDNLNVKDTKFNRTILIMPSWRSYLWKCDINEFKESIYYNKYNSLINNSDLITFLESNNYNIIFYPHYESQKYLNAFQSSNSRVIIASKEEYDVQDLLKRSSILITDYSSVFFDFAYMGKETIFYHFDNDNQYRKEGYIDLKNSIFGESLKTESEIVDKLKKITIIDNNINNESTNIEKINEFFGNRYKNIKQKTYEEIKKI